MDKIKRLIRKGIISTIFFFTVCFNTNFSVADVGSFDRYDSGGSDWGGSDWSSSSWGSSSYDDDWSWGGSSYGDYDSDMDLDGILWLIFIVGIFVVVAASKKGGKYPPMNMEPRNKPRGNQQETIFYDPSIVERIKVVDPEFNQEKFLRFAKDLYVRMQNAWTAREWEPMRSYETIELFEQHSMQLQGYIDTNRINVVDRISVDYARLYEFKQEGGKDILAINLRATKKDYIIDATTKEVLEGNKTEDRVTVYRMVFERKTGILTKPASETLETTNCPNCGAPNKIISSGKCEYCGSMITTDNHDWILASLEPARSGY